jgi:hypothetical protein
MVWLQRVYGTLGLVARFVMLEWHKRRGELGYQRLSLPNAPGLSSLAPPRMARFVAGLIPSPFGDMRTSPASSLGPAAKARAAPISTFARLVALA